MSNEEIDELIHLLHAAKAVEMFTMTDMERLKFRSRYGGDCCAVLGGKWAISRIDQPYIYGEHQTPHPA